jgi:glycosyltransferase involved in cell wall biosynthesis
MISISFIVFTYNSSDIICKTLKHLNIAINYFPIDHEIILVDNNSSDNTIDLAKRSSLTHDMGVSIIENPRQGLSFSRIEGVKRASKEFVCFIDDDNFISETFIKTLIKIISEHNPDVIGCRTNGIADIPFPSWWEKYQQNYACGIRFKESGFLNNPLHKMWGAGLTSRSKFLKPALLNMDLLCSDRIGGKQMSGGDTELNYRMRLLGAKLYNSNDLYLNHYMRAGRLNKKHLQSTREGNALAAINLDIYKFLLTNNKIYKLFNLSLLILIGALPLSIKYKTNYLKFALLRFRTIKERNEIQKIVYQKFVLNSVSINN